MLLYLYMYTCMGVYGCLHMYIYVCVPPEFPRATLNAVLAIGHSAAFQFGRKMADGRKTRRSAKHSVDTEWKQIEGVLCAVPTSSPFPLQPFFHPFMTA